MHELSVAQSMMNIVLDNAYANNASKVLKIEVVVGSQTGVVPDALRFAFDTLRQETIAADAELVITELKAAADCPACGAHNLAGQYTFFCSSCGAPIFPKGGDDLYIKELEIE